MDTFVQFLHKRGLKKEALSSSERALLQKEHKRIYKREWQRQKDQEGSRIQISFTHAERKQIEAAAKKHGTALTTFINKAVLAYLNQVFICPASDKALIHNLRMLLLKVGTHTNQLAFLCHRERFPVPSAIEDMRKKYQELDTVISHAFEYPQNLNHLIEQAVYDYPECKDSLIASCLNPTNHDYKK